jgi:hypothetical protein
MQPLRFNPITQQYVIELTGGTGKVETRKWRLAALFMLVFSVFHLSSPITALSQFVPVYVAPMTITGSTGAIDEEDLAEYEVRNQFATIKDSVTSAVVTYRYNMVPVDQFRDCEGGLFSSGSQLTVDPKGVSLPCSYNIRIRYRDTGANQNVIVRLRSANTTMDGVTTVYEFNSDAPDTFGTAPNANDSANQTVDRPVTFPPPHITHGARVYFLEVVVTKTANDGTPSPGFIAFVIGSAGCTCVP